MYQMEKITAENLVVMLEVQMWRLRVNATTRHARSRFGSLRLDVQLTTLIDDEGPRST